MLNATWLLTCSALDHAYRDQPADNTNRDGKTREDCLDLAKEYRIEYLCVFFEDKYELVWHNNLDRAFCLSESVKTQRGLPLHPDTPAEAAAPSSSSPCSFSKPPPHLGAVVFPFHHSSPKVQRSHLLARPALQVQAFSVLLLLDLHCRRYKPSRSRHCYSRVLHLTYRRLPFPLANTYPQHLLAEAFGMGVCYGAGIDEDHADLAQIGNLDLGCLHD